MKDKINTEQPLMLQPECVDCKFYDGFGQCLEHGDRLKDNCEDFELIFTEVKESERMKKAIRHILYENYTDAAVIEGVEIAEIVAWLEKQGEVAYNPYKVTVKSIANMCDKYATKMNNEEDANDFLQNVKIKCKDAIEFEKQGEDKPTENEELKFRRGDKIVSKQDGKVYTVGTAYYVTGDNICLHGTDGSHKWVNRDDLDRNYHLWTSEDPEQGQVKESAISQHEDKTCKENRNSLTSKLDAVKVIAWLVANIIDFEYYVRLFRKDFEI